MAYTRFKADKDIMDALVHLRKKTPAGGRRKATAAETALATSFWSKLYTDDAGVVSQLPEQLRNRMDVVVVVCSAFSLTVSEARTEIMCLRTMGMPETTAIFSVAAAGQVHNQTNEFVHLGGTVNHNIDLFIEVDQRTRNAWCSFRKYTLELYIRPSALLELKIRMLRAEVFETMLYGCVAWSLRRCRCQTLRRVHHRFLTLSGSVGEEESHRPPDFLSGRAYLCRREVITSSQACVGGGSCPLYLGRAWRTRDCQSV